MSISKIKTKSLELSSVNSDIILNNTVNLIDLSSDLQSSILDTKTIFQNNSSDWQSTYTTFQSNSSTWQSTYTTVVSNSSDWQSTYTTFQSNSSDWESNYTTVISNSSVWSMPIKLTAEVKNVEGSTLYKGDVVYTYGAVGDVMSVKKASNQNDTTSSKTLGFVNQTIQ
jgi:hypothetical protein